MMLTAVIAFFLSHQPHPATCQTRVDQAGYTIRCAGPKSVRANNWWDHRPAGHLFAKDETEPYIRQVPKGGL